MRRTVFILLSIIMILGLSGCKLVPSVELTEDEQKVIAEYSAGLLLKYDKNYKGSLKKLEEEEDDGIGFVQNDEAMMPAQEMPPENLEGDFNQPEFSEDIVAENPQGVEEPEYSTQSIAEALALDGFQIIYKSYETHKIYPEEESADLVFSMQSQEGMELLVVGFGITNDGEGRRLCDVLDSGASFRLLINGQERVNANRTILLNDLSSYCEEIDGYGMVDAVLVFEVADGTSAGINTLDLIVKKDGNSTTHRLK